MEQNPQQWRGFCVLQFIDRAPNEKKVAWLLPKHGQKPITRKFQLSTREFNDMGLRSLELAFNEFQRQASGIDVEHTFKQFSSLLDQLQDNERLKPSKGLNGNCDRLARVDFFPTSRHAPHILHTINKYQPQAQRKMASDTEIQLEGKTALQGCHSIL
jgi:hypothetical protein